MRKSDQLLAAAVLSVIGGISAIAVAAPTIDGTRDATGYTQIAVQTANTGFGDSNNNTGQGGSELDNMYYNVDLAAGKLNLFLGGNLETNNNKLVLFFDTIAGAGQNVLAANNPDVNFNNLNTKYAGMKFDTNFAPDHFLSFSRDQGDGGVTSFGNVYTDYAQLLTAGGGRGGYLGKIAVAGTGPDQQGFGVPTDAGVDPTLPQIVLGDNDNNLAGVNGAQGTAADPTAAAAVNTGTEISLNLADFNITGDFKLMAFINGSNHDYVSNQVLAGLPGTQGNLGGDNAGTFNGTVGGINWQLFAGDQFVTIPVTLPTIAYNVDANGNYSNGANFTGGVVPNGGNGRVLFGSVITAARTVTIDTPVTLSSLTFDNTKSYTLAGTNTISIAGSGQAAPAVQVLHGAHVISAPVTLTNDATIDIAASSALTITQPLTAAGRNVFKTGPGGLTLAPITLNSLSVSGGIVAFTGTTNTVLKGLTITSPAVVDIGKSTIVLDYDTGFSPLATLKAYVHGTTSNSLISTAAGANRTIGYVDTAAFPSLVSYNGTPLDATALVFRQVLAGDSNLSLTVDFDDLLALAKNYGATGKEWYQGDFNYDGNVNFDDLLLLAKNYNGTLTGSATAALPANVAADFVLARSLVPEPTMMLGGLLAGGLVARRRK